MSYAFQYVSVYICHTQELSGTQPLSVSRIFRRWLNDRIGKMRTWIGNMETSAEFAIYLSIDLRLVTGSQSATVVLFGLVTGWYCYCTNYIHLVMR